MMNRQSDVRNEGSMNDQKYLSLIKIVETGSYTKAAAELSLSQPAVSQHMHALESELQVKLFERKRGTLKLTREGRTVVKYARRMVSVQNNLRQALENIKTKITSLTVGITHTAESNAIVEALASFANAEDSGVTFRIHTDTTENLYNMFMNFELDFAIVEGRNPEQSLNYMLLDTDCLILAVPPDHRLADKSMITMSELHKEKLILRRPRSDTRSLFEAALETHNMRIDAFNVVMEINNIATIKDLIRRGLGVSVLPKSACMDEIGEKKLMALSIENLSMMRETNIVYSDDFEYVDFLQDLVKRYNEMRR